MLYRRLMSWSSMVIANGTIHPLMQLTIAMCFWDKFNRLLMKVYLFFSRWKLLRTHSSACYWIAKSQNINSAESRRMNKGEKCNHWWKKIWAFEIGQWSFSGEDPWSFIEKFNAQGARAKEERRFAKIGLTGFKTSLIGPSRNFAKSPSNKKKGRLSLKNSGQV